MGAVLHIRAFGWPDANRQRDLRTQGRCRTSALLSGGTCNPACGLAAKQSGGVRCRRCPGWSGGAPPPCQNTAVICLLASALRRQRRQGRWSPPPGSSRRDRPEAVTADIAILQIPVKQLADPRLAQRWSRVPTRAGLVTHELPPIRDLCPEISVRTLSAGNGQGRRSHKRLPGLKVARQLLLHDLLRRTNPDP